MIMKVKMVNTELTGGRGEGGSRYTVDRSAQQNLEKHIFILWGVRFLKP